MFLLFVVYAALTVPYAPEEWYQVHPEFPMTTLEECTKKAEMLAADSMKNYPELANYKFYRCIKEST